MSGMIASNDNSIHTHRTGFSGNDEWYTPSKYIEMAREVMGSIDVDPASNHFAQETVRAETYYTIETNGLDKDWHGNVWMNPPYSRGLISPFIEKLLAEFQSGRCIQAIVLTNNSTDTGWFALLAKAGVSVCFPKGRIKFQKPDGTMGRTPPQGQMFCYLGSNRERFRSIFEQSGFVGLPALAA